jgi:glycosyltransferase involved in cell wall biosynthesis
VRICLIGKYPPIQGGVSMRTFWTAHALAQRGHDVHVVTNAKEAAPPFRMHMRSQDWRRCEANYGVGSVAVHWSDPVDRTQSYIPSASPFVSKLAGVAARLHAEQPFDLIYSFYLEPYAVAGHLAAQIAGVPHVVRMAGSDAGRLWQHPQLEAIYDHVLRSAEAVIAAGAVAKRAVARDVEPARIDFDGGIVIPEDLFTPDGPPLDIPALRAEVMADRDLRDLMWGDFNGERPYFGIYGKLGARKGSFALLDALARLQGQRIDVGLVALAHGDEADEKKFRGRASALGLRGRILQLPFLPHWRVPEFLRGCLAVCCLEQDFPIGFHMPIVPREVLLCGASLVGSTEVIRKLPGHERLPHRYGCVAATDATDSIALSKLLAAIATDPGPRAAVGTRGRAFARDLQDNIAFPQALEQILAAAVARWGGVNARGGDGLAAHPSPAHHQRVYAHLRRAMDAPRASPSRGGSEPAARHQNTFADIRVAAGKPADAPIGRFRLTTLANVILAEYGESVHDGQEIDVARAQEILRLIERAATPDSERFRSLIAVVQTEIAIAMVEDDIQSASAAESDPLFRLHMQRWAADDADFFDLVPFRDPNARIIRCDFDVSNFARVDTPDELLNAPIRGHSHLVAFVQRSGRHREPLLIDEAAVEVLEMCDGTRTLAEVIAQPGRECETLDLQSRRKCIEQMFLAGLFSLHEGRIDSRVAPANPLNRIEVSISRAAVEVRL